MIKRVKRSGAEGHERLPHQCEFDHLHGTGGAARTNRRECRNTVHFGIRQNRCVEGGGFFCFLSVPKIRDYFRHRGLPCDKDAESQGATREISVQASSGFHHDPLATERYLAMRAAIRRRRPHCLGKAEGAGEPVESRRNVAIENIGAFLS
jgi:hypothetical protein